MAISIGKLDIYVAAGGFHPKRVLPIVVDVGTNNQNLINDEFYIGLKQKRLDGEEYYDLLDEIVASLFYRYPKALL